LLRRQLVVAVQPQQPLGAGTGDRVVPGAGDSPLLLGTVRGDDAVTGGTLALSGQLSSAA
jgi:hypothetical protein